MARTRPKKSRTPPPPRRPVQAPKLRTAPRDPARNRMLLYALGASALIVVAAVIGFVLLAGRGDGNATDDLAKKFQAIGGGLKTVSAEPNFRLNGKKLPYRHLPSGTLPKGFHYSTNPPTSGIHTNETVVYGIYDEAVPTVSTVHNLEHGAVVIRYGPRVPAGEIQKLRDFYLADANGLVVAPMAGLGNKITLAAWTYDPARASPKYDGEGHLATATRFDEDAFKGFLDAYRGKGPESDHGPRYPGFKITDLKPGGP
jgi:Protein of unknown function (DUF3105)